jgi:hypothetical protein
MTKTMTTVIGSALLLAAGPVSAADTGPTHIRILKAWPAFVHLVLDTTTPCDGQPTDHYVIIDPASKDHIVSLAYSAWASGKAVNVRFDCMPPGDVPDLGTGSRNVVKGIRAIH